MNVIGSSLTVSGSPVFEIQAPGLGQVLQAPDSELTLFAPLLGGFTLVDGERFTVFSGSTKTTFEFDNNGNVASGNLAVPFTADSTQPELTAAIANAIQNASALAVPITVQDGAIIFGEVPYTINTTGSGITQSNASPFVLQVPAAGGQAITDGKTFTIREGIQSAGHV